MNKHDRLAKYRMRELTKKRLAKGNCPACGGEKNSNNFRCSKCEKRQQDNRRRLKEEGKVLIRVRRIRNILLYNMMIKKGVNTEQLSKYTGVSVRNVTKWITDGAVPRDVDVRIRVNGLLGCEIFTYRK